MARGRPGDGNGATVLGEVMMLEGATGGARGPRGRWSSDAQLVVKKAELEQGGVAARLDDFASHEKGRSHWV